MKNVKSESDTKVTNQGSTSNNDKVATMLSDGLNKEQNPQKEDFPSLNNKESKERIKVFKDDSDIEQHLKESRKRLKDQMDNVLSDNSNPPTPDKSVAKVPVNSTDESAAISEGALADARNYISGVYGKSKANFMRQDPFDYVDKDQQSNREKNNSMVRKLTTS